MKPLLLLLACLLTACGHIEYQPLVTIDHVDHSRGYRLQHVFHDQQDDDLFLVLLFSGGGTRAAAFGYGVLEVLAETPITGHGKTASLLEKTDLVAWRLRRLDTCHLPRPARQKHRPPL